MDTKSLERLINNDSTARPQGHCLGFSLRTYPNKCAEGSIWRETGQIRRYQGIKVEKREQQKQSTIDAAVSRTKKGIRHNVLAMGGDRLWSLTFRDNLQDVDEAWRIWGVFLKRLARSGITFQYVVVAEKQKRGAIHFHFTGNKFLNVRVLRHHWYAAVGKVTDANGDIVSAGSINVTPPRKGKMWKAYKLAAYLGKYINKDMIATFGKHRYRKSRGKNFIEIIKEVFYMPHGLHLQVLEHIFRIKTGARVVAVHSTNRESMWLTSWDTRPDKYQVGFVVQCSSN